MTVTSWGAAFRTSLETTSRVAAWPMPGPATASFAHAAQRWGDQPLFADQSPETRALADADRARNTARGLASSLRGMGAGAMAPVWEQLPGLTMPVVCAAGERDHKYRAIAETMAGLLPHGEAVVIPGAGHAAHLENPAAVANLIAG